MFGEVYGSDLGGISKVIEGKIRDVLGRVNVDRRRRQDRNVSSK